MATIFLDPGGDATFIANNVLNGGLYNNTNGTPYVATDFVHGAHIKSYGFRPGFNDALTKTTPLANTGTRTSFYIYINALPNATATVNAIIGNTGVVVAIKITNTGIIQLWEASTQIGTNGITLSTGQWYRISLAYTITSTTINNFNLFVNGTSSISVTNATITNISGIQYKIGNSDTDSLLDIRLSDIYIDNSSSLVDPGNIWVTAKRPFANGTNNQWTTQIGSGGSGYGSGHSSQVNERPLSNTNGWSIQNASTQTEEYTIESKSQGDIDISKTEIIDYMGWVDCKVASNSTANIIVGGVASNISVITIEEIFTKIAGSNIYPTGNTDIGINTNSVNQLFSLYECGIIVAYNPRPFSPFPSYFRS